MEAIGATSDLGECFLVIPVGNFYTCGIGGHGEEAFSREEERRRRRKLMKKCVKLEELEYFGNTYEMYFEDIEIVKNDWGGERLR